MESRSLEPKEAWNKYSDTITQYCVKYLLSHTEQLTNFLAPEARRTLRNDDEWLQFLARIDTSELTLSGNIKIRYDKDSGIATIPGYVENVDTKKQRKLCAKIYNSIVRKLKEFKDNADY